MPPRTPKRPFERVADDLRARIAAGEWGPDQALPSGHELAGHYGVSQSTITRAIKELAAEGLVYAVSRWGVFVTGEDH